MANNNIDSCPILYGPENSQIETFTLLLASNTTKLMIMSLLTQPNHMSQQNTFMLLLYSQLMLARTSRYSILDAQNTCPHSKNSSFPVHTNRTSNLKPYNLAMSPLLRFSGTETFDC